MIEELKRRINVIAQTDNGWLITCVLLVSIVGGTGLLVGAIHAGTALWNTSPLFLAGIGAFVFLAMPLWYIWRATNGEEN